MNTLLILFLCLSLQGCKNDNAVKLEKYIGSSHIISIEKVTTPDKALAVSAFPIQTYSQQMQELANAYLNNKITYFQYLQLKNELEFQLRSLSRYARAVMT